MPSNLQALKTALGIIRLRGAKPQWNEVLGELLFATYSPLTPEVERLLLAILRFEGELVLDETSDGPHSMTPEEMLKSVAAQALGQWTGARYLMTLRRIEAASLSASLVSILQAVIEKVRSNKGKPRSAEPVAELHGEDPAHTLRLDYAGGEHPEVTEYELGDWVRPEPLTVLREFGMTAVSRSRR
jgi:hypothetical protein